jgi:GNAT superfamily N-acetyltransferase
MSEHGRRPGTIAVRMMDADDARDTRLVDHLASLINAVYADAERGLWREGTTRTTAAELAGLIRDGEIALATRDGQTAGFVRIHDVADDMSEIGMLVADPARRGSGVGSALVGFAEQRSRRRGLRAMRLELLVPRGLQHPGKELLEAWYDRIGYRRVCVESIDEGYPQLVSKLATPCDIAIYEKSLQPSARTGSSAHDGAYSRGSGWSDRPVRETDEKEDEGDRQRRGSEADAMTDVATERLLEQVAEHASAIREAGDDEGGHAQAISDAVVQLRRRGDTLVRREDLWIVLEYADSSEVLLESQRTELKASFTRIANALGRTP